MQLELTALINVNRALLDYRGQYFVIFLLLGSKKLRAVSDQQLFGYIFLLSE